MHTKLKRGSRKALKRKASKRKASKRHSKKMSRKLSRNIRHFGSKSSLLNYMGNYSPAEISIANSYVGMSPDQYNGRLSQIPMSVRSNFYTNL
jgi:hypothetical protein